MMKKSISISLFFFICVLQSWAQSPLYEVRAGNEKYHENDFVAAEELYRKSLAKDPNTTESAYNLGDALYRQGKYEESAKYYAAAATQAEDEDTKAKAYHNLGNALLKNQKLKESIEAYKSALVNNPKDEDSRYNLAYAQKLLKEQQEQEQQQQDQQNQDQEENQEEQEEKNEQEQDQEEQEENKEEQQQEQQEQQEQQQEEQEEQEQQQQPQEQQVSREDAERILEALNEKEKEVQEKLKKKKGKAVEINIEKDW